MRLLEHSGVVVDGPGVAAPPRSEEVGRHQRIRNGGQVGDHQRPLRARVGVQHVLRQEALSRAGLALEQHGQRAAREHRQAAAQLPHRRRSSPEHRAFLEDFVVIGSVVRSALFVRTLGRRDGVEVRNPPEHLPHRIFDCERGAHRSCVQRARREKGLAPGLRELHCTLAIGVPVRGDAAGAGMWQAIRRGRPAADASGDVRVHC